MIPVNPVAEPADWPADGLTKGKDWLAQHPVADRPKQFRPYNLWSGYLSDLGAGFRWRCGYTAMYEDNGTVDHFEPWEDLAGTANEWRAYDWTNFRYASGWLNSARKRTKVPDPYLVGTDWFRILLPSLILEATPNIPLDQRGQATNVLRWLKDDERVMRARRTWYRLYREKKLTLEGLDEVAPLIADALRRQPEFQV